MALHDKLRSRSFLAVFALVPLLGGVGCTTALCLASNGEPAISVVYRTTGPVGLLQRLTYHEQGVLRLDGADRETYCSRLRPIERDDFGAKMREIDLKAELSRFGAQLRYPGCFLQEEITIRTAYGSKTARVDALDGELLRLIDALERLATKEFGRHYQFSVVDQATDRACVNP